MRRRLGYSAVAVLAVAAVELAILIGVARVIGAAATVLLVLVTSLLGAWVLRREGMRAWRRFQGARAAGTAPGDEVVGGLLGLAAGLLLVLPGFLTDVVGLLLLSPPGRRVAAVGARRAAERRLSPAAAGDVFGPRRVRVRAGRPDRGPRSSGRPAAAPPVIEGEVVDH